MPGSVLLVSTPAEARTKPCRVSTMRVGPRRATSRTVSASIAVSRSRSRRIRPSALLTTFDVMSRMSPSRSPELSAPPAAAAIKPARSSPGRISGSPGTPQTS